MMEKTKFRPRYEELTWLINQRRFRQALEPARQLAEESDRAEAWFVYNLVVCLTGLHGGARKLSPRLIERLKQCEDRTPLVEGDARRDRVNALLLIRPMTKKLQEEVEHEVAEIALLHAHERNHLAVLTGTQGRYAYACGKYSIAARLHAEADRQWAHMGAEADRQWIYNNLIHWLKAEVRLHGPRSYLATELRRRIASECPEGAKNRSSEADRISWPVVGNIVDDLARAYQHRPPDWLHRRLHR